MTGTLTAEFERDILGLIQLNNAFVQITIDEESIKDFIWGADVYLIGLEFSVDGWFGSPKTAS